MAVQIRTQHLSKSFGPQSVLRGIDLTIQPGEFISIVGKSGKLAGVFTDGDLRRRMGADDRILERTLREVMTPRPICIRENALAAEALKIFNERNIDDLIVINQKREPVGLVDLQDLPKMKLM